jgi:hypothetical protein
MSATDVVWREMLIYWRLITRQALGLGLNTPSMKRDNRNDLIFENYLLIMTATETTAQPSWRRQAFL